MRIHADFEDKILYIRLCGELDEHNASRARLEADRLAEDFAPRSEKAVFDLKEVSFMDSTGIGFLIGRFKLCKRYGIYAYVRCVNPTTDKILSVSGVYSLLPRI